MPKPYLRSCRAATCKCTCMHELGRLHLLPFLCSITHQHRASSSTTIYPYRKHLRKPYQTNKAQHRQNGVRSDDDCVRMSSPRSNLLDGVLIGFAALTTANPAATATTSHHSGIHKPTPPTSSFTAKRSQIQNPASA